MYKKDELEREILNNDFIYCDTCIAMSKGFEHFIYKFSVIFKKHKKKIVVISEVYQELLNKSVFGDKSEKYYASKAIELINLNIEMFEVEGSNKLSGQIFADPKLLARLIENQTGKTQMLLTKDSGLSLDANRFNSLNSVNGKPINVYYVNKYGDMNRFKNRDIQESKAKIEYVEVEKIVEKPVVKVIEKRSSFVNNVVKPVCIATITYIAIDKRKNIVKFIKDSINKISTTIA